MCSEANGCLLFELPQDKHPSALNSFDRVIKPAHKKQIVVFLDYDGTLSPIVEDPEKAFMSPEVSSS